MKKGYEKAESLRTNNLEKVRFMCSCGHKAIIPYWVDKQMCTWCGHWVYRNKREEFKDKLKMAMLKINKKEGK